MAGVEVCLEALASDASAALGRLLLVSVGRGPCSSKSELSKHVSQLVEVSCLDESPDHPRRPRRAQPRPHPLGGTAYLGHIEALKQIAG